MVGGAPGRGRLVGRRRAEVQVHGERWAAHAARRSRRARRCGSRARDGLTLVVEPDRVRTNLRETRHAHSVDLFAYLVVASC